MFGRVCASAGLGQPANVRPSAATWRRGKRWGSALAIGLSCSLLSGTGLAAGYTGKWSGSKNPARVQEALTHFTSWDVPIHAMLWRPDGQWMMISYTAWFRSDGFVAPDALFQAMAAGKSVVAGDCNESGGCAVVLNDWQVLTWGSNVPACAKGNVDAAKAAGAAVTDIEITNSKCMVLGTGGYALYSTSFESDLQKAVFDRRASGRTIDALTIGFDEKWSLVAGHNPMYNGPATPGYSLNSLLNQRASGTNDGKPSQIALGPNGDWIYYTQGLESPNPTPQIEAIEYALGPTGNTNIWKRMVDLNVTGVSIALVNHNAATGRAAVSLARGYGRRRNDTGLPVLARTPFALASLSKYLGALAIADFQETDTVVARTTDLRNNPMPTGSLRTWVTTGNDTNSAFRKSLPSTIRSNSIANTMQSFSLDTLMNHTSRIVSERDGSSGVRQALWSANNDRPTTEWLYGRRCVAGSCVDYENSSWQVSTPALTADYDSANYLVLQAYLEDRTGTNAHANLQTRVFNPIGMPDSSSRIDMSAAEQLDIAWKHSLAGTPDADMVNSAWVFGGGVRASAVDYGNAMTVLLNQGLAANGTRVLNAATVDNFFLRAPTGSTLNRAWGVAFDRNVTDIREGTDEAFMHGGSFSGTSTWMCGNPTDNQGLVVLMNSNDSGTDQLLKEIQAAYISQVTWRAGSDCAP